MKKVLDVQIGERVRKKREEMKLSREKLAEMIEISPQFLAQIEVGRRGMSSVTLYKICRAMSVSADYLILAREEDNDTCHLNMMVKNLDDQYLPYLEDMVKIFVLAVNRQNPLVM